MVDEMVVVTRGRVGVRFGWYGLFSWSSIELAQANVRR